MLKRFFAIMALGIVTWTGMTGCYTTGKVTGEAAEATEEGAREFGRGYDAGKQ